MDELILTTYDWVPPPPRGYVRDLRARWALEETGLPYRVESTPFDRRDAAHLAHQPFGQVPWLADGETTVFESGAIVLHIGTRAAGTANGSPLLPADPRARADAVAWLFAALNSVEAASLPWSLLRFSGDRQDAAASAAGQALEAFLKTRLDRLEAVLSGRTWLAGGFSVADILMADVLRLVDRLDGLGPYPDCRAYLARATARPAFTKAYADQLAHFAAGDRARRQEQKQEAP